MVIDTIVTHLAYWRQGHATDITNWFKALADLDNASLGVAGAPMGKIFLERMASKRWRMLRSLDTRLTKNLFVPGLKDARHRVRNLRHTYK